MREEHQVHVIVIAIYVIFFSHFSAVHGVIVLKISIKLCARNRCISCIESCQQKHNTSTAWTEAQVAPPALDACIFESCGATRICPPLLHKVKFTWRDLPTNKIK